MEKNTNVNDKINKFNFDIYEVYYLLLFLLRLYMSYSVKKRLYELYEEDKEKHVCAIKDYYMNYMEKYHHKKMNKSRLNYLSISIVVRILAFSPYFLHFDPCH